MAKSIFCFTWPVSLSGYWWEEQDNIGLFKESASVLAWDKKAHVRYYSPLRDETGLFLTLAETPPEADSMLGFANRFGRLGPGVDDTATMRWIIGETRPRSPQRPIERIDSWIGAIRWLHHLVALWQAARSRDEKTLAELLLWEDDSVLFLSFPGKSSASSEVDDRCRFHFTGTPLRIGDNVTAAFLYLHKNLNQQLRLLISPSLAWDYGEHQSELSFEVCSLWAAILLQFAEALGGQHDYQRCAGCSRWFELAPGVNRADRLTCSDSCRQRFYRMRRERAVELNSQGKTARKIAKELGSDLKTVKGWINRAKEH